MANSGPDVVNATLGVVFGVAFGGVWTLVEKVIEGLSLFIIAKNNAHL